MVLFAGPPATARQYSNWFKLSTGSPGPGVQLANRNSRSVMSVEDPVVPIADRLLRPLNFLTSGHHLATLAFLAWQLRDCLLILVGSLRGRGRLRGMATRECAARSPAGAWSSLNARRCAGVAPGHRTRRGCGRRCGARGRYATPFSHASSASWHPCRPWTACSHACKRRSGISPPAPAVPFCPASFASSPLQIARIAAIALVLGIAASLRAIAIACRRLHTVAFPTSLAFARRA